MLTPPIVTDSPFADEGPWSAPPNLGALKDLGFKAFSATLFDDSSWARLPALLDGIDRAGLSLATVRIKADVSTGVVDPRLGTLLPLLSRRQSRIELFVYGSGQYDVASAPRADGRAIELVGKIADLAADQGVGLSLAHRAGFWLERLEDSVRLLMRMNRDEIGVTFSLFDWFAVDGENLEPRLHLAIPRLTNLLLCGVTRHAPDLFTPESLDASGYDGSHFLATAARIGYAGPVSLDLRPAPNVDPIAMLRRSRLFLRKAGA